MNNIKPFQKKKLLFRLRSMEMGGVQKVLIDLFRHLDKNKYEISLLLDIRQGILIPDIPKEIQIYSIGKGREEFSSITPVLYLQLIYRRVILEIYKLFPFLLKKKLNFTPDIEVAFSHGSLAGLIKSPFKKSKKISWFHSDIRFYSHQYGRNIMQYMKRCDLNIFVSRTTLSNFERHLEDKVPDAKCVYNPFDFKKIISKSEMNEREDIFNTKTDHVFVSVGRVTFQKGYDILLDIHSELIKEGFYHQIFIIGDGPDYLNLKEKVSEMKLEHTFLLLGAKENPYPYIRQADYYIQPSRYEAYPLAIGEALILNKPIIATDCGGIKEMLIPDKTGIVIDFSKDQIKQAMKDIMLDSRIKLKLEDEQRKLDFEAYNMKIYREVEKVFS